MTEASDNKPGDVLEAFRSLCGTMNQHFAESAPDATKKICSLHCEVCLAMMKKALDGNVFGGGVGGYSGEELTAASIAVFGEMSSPQAKTDKEKETQTTEAQAIAAELFNRQNSIKDTGITDLAAYERAINERAAAAQKLDVSQRDLYDSEQAAIRAMRANRKLLYRYLANNRSMPNTLTNLASANQQFLGYDKAKKDMKAMADKGAIKGEECARQCQRWEAATKAVRGFAADPGSLKAFNDKVGWFDSNLSNNNGNRTKQPGDVRIGGNDFFKKKD